MDDLWRLSAAETAEMVKLRRASAREVLASVLSRIDAVNPLVNAVVDLHREDASAAAFRVDELVAKGGDPGVLAGVPVTVKLTGDIEGHPVHQMLPGIPNQARAPRDSYTVANLRRAGAVFVGRTNVPEYNMRWDTENPVFGRTRNPWARDRVPGGSSGGGAAAVATGMGAIAHGSDLGGSIRQPAGSCGVVTIRPTVGRTPTLAAERSSSIDSQLMGVDGPLARSVRDVWLALTAMAAGRSDEPLAVPVPLSWSPPERLRVRVITRLDGVDQHPEVLASVRKAADALAEAGHEVEEAAPLPLRRMARDRNAFVWTTLRHTMSFEDEGSSPDLRRVWAHMLESTPRTGIGEYIGLLSRRADDMRAWDERMGSADVYLGPVASEPAFRIGADTGESRDFAGLLDSLQLVTALVVTALPVAVVPVGTCGSGVPLGVQLAGPRWREDVCLAAAQVIEDSVGIRTPVDPLPS